VRHGGNGRARSAYTRRSLLVFAAASTFFPAHFYSYGTLQHPQAAATIVLWMLILTPSGGELSVDSMLVRIAESARRERFVRREAEAMSRDARWPLRLVQWLLVVIYLSAALSKITVGKAAWLNGYTMTFYLLLDGSTHHVPLAIALAHSHFFSVLSAVIALAFELTFVVCVLFPPATPAYLATGVALHTGIWVLLRAPFFQFLALYAAFAEPMREVLRRRAPSGSRPPSSTVWTVV
jgi:hypothetical protein